MIKYVYVPLESKNPDMRNSLNKFVQQISHSSQQVNGTVNIIIPEFIEDLTDEQAIADHDLMA